MNEYERWSFDRGDARATELSDAIDELFSVLTSDPTVREDADDAGIDLDELQAAGRDSIQVSGAKPGLTGVETVIIVTIGAKLFESAWDEIVVPWLKRKFGPKPLGDKRDAKSD